MATMDCTDIKVLLSGLIDDEVDAETRHRAERHLVECDDCRRRMGEAESLTPLLLSEAESLGEGAELPDGFVGSILNQTVYQQGPADGRGPAWVSWLGWLAAAASLVLAVSIWVMDGRGPVPPGTGNDGRSVIAQAPAPPPRAVPAGYLKSSVLDDADIAPGDVGLDRQAQADAVDQAAGLLERFLAADDSSFAEIEEIKNIASYDEVLRLMGAASEHVGRSERLILGGAAGTLVKLMHGPLDQEKLRILRDDVRASGVIEHLYAISGQLDPSLTL